MINVFAVYIDCILKSILDFTLVSDPRFNFRESFFTVHCFRSNIYIYIMFFNFDSFSSSSHKIAAGFYVSLFWFLASLGSVLMFGVVSVVDGRRGESEC